MEEKEEQENQSMSFSCNQILLNGEDLQ